MESKGVNNKGRQGKQTQKRKDAEDNREREDINNLFQGIL